MKEEIEKAREELYAVISSDCIDYAKVLSISRKMDELIFEFYKNMIWKRKKRRW